MAEPQPPDAADEPTERVDPAGREPPPEPAEPRAGREPPPDPAEPRAGREPPPEPAEPPPEPAEPPPGPAEPQAGREPPPERWTGSAPVRPQVSPRGRRSSRRMRSLRERTAELPIVDGGADEPWPPPPPPRPANAPVTAPYPPPALPVSGPAPAGWRPGPAPPGWRPPGGRPYAPPAPPAPYRRRRRRWPWVLGTFGLTVAVCCGCCVSIVKPFVDQYPATATLPKRAVNLVQLDDAPSVAATQKREGLVRSRHWLADQVFAAIYAEPGTGARPVTIFGATQLILDPKKDLENEFAALAGELSPSDIRAVEPGPAGGHQRCADGRRAGSTVVICGWADHGSIAVAVFSGRTSDRSAELLRDLRTEIITRR